MSKYGLQQIQPCGHRKATFACSLKHHGAKLRTKPLPSKAAEYAGKAWPDVFLHPFHQVMWDQIDVTSVSNSIGWVS